jgi:hypothetical protein
MTHYKWLVAKRNREEAEEYALRVEEEGYDYCEVEEVGGTVKEVYEKLLKPDSTLTRTLKLSGINVEEALRWLNALISKGKGDYKVFLVDCHD